MKKTLCAILSLIIILTLAPFSVYADEESTVQEAQDTSTVRYETPFKSGTVNSEKFRIPAILTLDNGLTIAGADVRYDHGLDSPNNLETVLYYSDGYSNWNHEIINKFEDVEDGVESVESASFIDTAMVQIESAGRIIVITDAFPSGIGYPNARVGSGFIQIDSKRYLALKNSPETVSEYIESEDTIENYPYYVGDFFGDFASIYNVSDNSETQYSVDKEYNLYKNSQPLYTARGDKQIAQNVFYATSELVVFPTSYLWMRYTDDYGHAWSSPSILNEFVKSDDESFLGIAPGRGITIYYNDKDRVIFQVYDNSTGKERASTIYSDNFGETWQRGEATDFTLAAGKTSEAQVVDLGDGVLRMFARCNNDYIATADSTDGGVSWTKFSCDENLKGTPNCMSSFINTNLTVDGKSVVLGSYPSNVDSRRNGVVRTGVINEDKSISWINTYHVNNLAYSYSCLTQLDDGNIGLLYETENASIEYIVLTVDENGEISEINDNNVEFTQQESEHKVREFFKSILVKLQKLFKVF